MRPESKISQRRREELILSEWDNELLSHMLITANVSNNIKQKSILCVGIMGGCYVCTLIMSSEISVYYWMVISSEERQRCWARGLSDNRETDDSLNDYRLPRHPSLWHQGEKEPIRGFVFQGVDWHHLILATTKQVRGSNPESCVTS